VTAYREAFATFESNGRSEEEPEWLSDLRRRGFDRFSTLGFPTMRDEDWHYTSVAPIAEASFTLPPAVARFSEATLAPYLINDEWPRLVFLNGRYAPGLSHFGDVPVEVEITTLREGVRAREPEIRDTLATLASMERNAFAALNTAFISDGVVVRVPGDVALAAPIHVVWLSDAGSRHIMTHPRMLVTVGPHGRAAIVETFAGMPDAMYFTNAVTELRLESGARVEHYKVQRESADAFHVGTTQALQARDSVLHAFSFAEGARLSRSNVYTTLAGPGAEGRLNGLYLLAGSQHCDHQTFVHHAAEQCASRELYKGIIDDTAHGVFNGKVLVDPIAQKTDGKQTNHALLLSERAKIDTKPQLEIFADDVKCTHGATVGRLDANLLFYLKSRGIGRDTARALLTYAFAAEVLETIELDDLRHALETLAFARYNQPAGA
jgi:Fe-S cluster assembly protein SufD